MKTDSDYNRQLNNQIGRFTAKLDDKAQKSAQALTAHPATAGAQQAFDGTTMDPVSGTPATSDHIPRRQTLAPSLPAALMLLATVAPAAQAAVLQRRFDAQTPELLPTGAGANGTVARDIAVEVPGLHQGALESLSGAGALSSPRSVDTPKTEGLSSAATEGSTAKPRSKRTVDSAEAAHGVNLVAEAKDTMPTRESDGEAVLKQLNLDGAKEYAYTDLMPLGLGGAAIRGHKPLIKLYVEFQTSTLPFWVRDYPPIVRKLPDLNKRHEESKANHIQKYADKVSKITMRTLSRAGVGSSTDASIMSVLAKGTGRALTQAGTGLLIPIQSEGSLGYILKTSDKSSAKLFAIVPSHHGEKVIPLPENNSDRISWIKDNAHLFFETPPPPEAWGKKADYSLNEITSNISAEQAATDIASRVFKDALSPLEEEAFGETDVETAIHAARDATYPLYGTVRNIGNGNYKAAVASAGFDAASLYPGAKAAIKGVKNVKQAGKMFGPLKIKNQIYNAAAPAAETAAKGVSISRTPQKPIASLAGKVGVDQPGYRQPQNFVARGSMSHVYRLNDELLVKEYKNTIGNGYTNSLREANNNANAFRRLHGKDTATVAVHSTADPEVKIVTVTMVKVPGETLDSIIKRNDPELAQEIWKLFTEKAVANEMIEKLKVNGISHNDINLANILYDQRTKKFNIIDFDGANINPKGIPLTESQSIPMRSKLDHDFNEFGRKYGLTL